MKTNCPLFRVLTRALGGAVLCLCVAKARGDVRLPAVLGSHMVLQQNAEVTLWGWAYDGEKVVVSTSWGPKAETVANARGEWSVKVQTPPARPLAQGLHPEHIDFAVPDENAVQINDILIGEVWLCSGQSNMTMMLGPDYPEGHNGWYGDKYWKEESARTARPALRLCNIEKTAAPAPRDDCKAVLPDHITLPKDANGLTADLRTGWQVSGPETAPFFSAVGYYFGATIQESLGVPVGLVASSVGGSPIQAWLPLDSLHKVPAFASAANRVHRNGNAALFNGMIAPLTPMRFRGVLWYQGESNTGTAPDDYAALLRNLITDWRERFHQPRLPFGIVQLANYGKPDSGKRESKVAPIRAAQAAVQRSLPDVGLAVAIDLGEERIHPPNKRDVARRLALWARAEVYKTREPALASPRYLGHSVEGARIRVRFENGGAPLKANSNGITGFELAGADGRWFPAQARLDARSIVVSSSEVPVPVHIRYAWADNPQGCNLYNEAGLPCAPFSSDFDLPINGQSARTR